MLALPVHKKLIPCIAYNNINCNGGYCIYMYDNVVYTIIYTAMYANLILGQLPMTCQ